MSFQLNVGQSVPASALPCAFMELFRVPGQNENIPQASSPIQRYAVDLRENPFPKSLAVLRQPVAVLLYQDSDGWCCERRDLSILAFGATPEESVRSFYEDFVVLWTEISQQPDHHLTSNAQKVKRAFRRLVEPVGRA